MKKISETYKELGIAFTFPIEIKDANSNSTYYEYSDGHWRRSEYDADGNKTYYEYSGGYWGRSEYNENGDETYHEDSDGCWHRREYDHKGNQTYFENSFGRWRRSEYDSDGNHTYSETSDASKRGMPLSASCIQKLRARNSCNDNIIEVDGKKYKLTEL